jgi:hypothetical protein
VLDPIVRDKDPRGRLLRYQRIDPRFAKDIGLVPEDLLLYERRPGDATIPSRGIAFMRRLAAAARQVTMRSPRA